MSKSSDVLYSKTKKQVEVLEDKIDRLECLAVALRHVLGDLMLVVGKLEEQQVGLNKEVRQWITKH